MAAAEQKKSYAVVKNFTTLNTKANRTAIGEDEFSWIENVMPIGAGNLKTIPQSLTMLDAGANAVTFANTVTLLTSTNINVADYILAAESDGRMEYFNLTGLLKGNVAVTGTFSSSGVSTAQYKNERVIIGDPDKGLFTWDSNNTVSIGSVGSIAITSSGSGYGVVPTVNINAPNDANGVQATAVVTVNTGTGSVVDTKITAAGTGYTTPPTLSFAAPNTVGGVRASAYALVNGGAIVQVVITNAGSGYTSTPAITITPNSGGASGAITAVLNTGGINYIAITNAGSGYTSPPTISFSGGGGGSGAAALAQLATFKTGTVTVVVTNGGANYTNSANTIVTFTGGGGASAAATAVLSGNVVNQVVMTNPGTGYTSAPTVAITGGGGSGATAIAVVNLDQIVDVATFSGRVWVAAGRTVYYSAAGSYSDFTSVSAGSFVLTDSTLHGNIKCLLSANNFLYIFGDDSINVFSDVRVNSFGQTLFTNANLTASIGSKRIYAIFPYYRSVLFMNDYGIFSLVGSTASKLSDPLEGIFPYIDFTLPVSGGQALVNNILCAVFNFTYNDPLSSARQIQAVFFEKKWFITSQGSTSYITSVPFSGQINLYANIGQVLYKMYTAPDLPINSTIRTALLPMGDNIRTKQALKFGIEVSQNGGNVITATVDSEIASSPAVTLANYATWINNSGLSISWTNNSSAIVVWTFGGNYFLYKSDAQQYGKYLGLTVTSTSPLMTFNTFEFEHELRVRF
jgi:hypothetical protein